MVVAKKNPHFHGCQMATTNSVKLHKLRKLIAFLSDKEGLGLEFISIYIPCGKPVDEVVSFLKESDYAVMKSDNVGHQFQYALRNVIQRLKMQKEIPENGLAIFAGTFEYDLEDKDLSVEEVIPPKPITTYLYDVNDHFQLEPLREMLRNQRIVGILSLDSKEASIGLLNGERFEYIENLTSGIHGKSGKGGSSQRRYERERDSELIHYFHRVAEHAAKAFLENHTITAFIVGGPGPTKEDFLKGDYLHYELKNSLLSTVDTQSADREGVREVLRKSSETLKNMCAPEEKMIMQRFLSYMGKQDDLAIYGLDPVLKALKNGEVEVALVTDNADAVEIVAVCKKCGLSKMKIVAQKEKTQTIQELKSHPCEKCNSVEFAAEEKDIIDVLEDLSSLTNAKVEVISTESVEKAKLTALGGFVALLRYRPH